MVFYTYQYFENKVHSNTVLKYIIIISVLVLFFFLIVKYLQNRISSKYRDLIIILILIIILRMYLYVPSSDLFSIKLETSKLFYK